MKAQFSTDYNALKVNDLNGSCCSVAHPRQAIAQEAGKFRYIIRCVVLLLMLGGWNLPILADDTEYVIRYVSTAGSFENDGTSWANAKNNLQNAIDEAYEEIRGSSNKLGYIFVAGSDSEEGMTYVPTRRSTEEADGSVFNTSFRIYAGIHVYGGFKGDEVPNDPAHPELLPQQRIMTNNHTYARVESDIDAENIGETVRRWNFKYKTVLSGNHSTNDFSFTFSETRGIYNTNFPLSSYHVVWFATNGKIVPDPEGDEKNLVGHYKGLTSPATVDGCTIEGGYASSTNLKGHDHTGFGGGVYMVRNSMLRNCIIHHCSATQRGGAVYLDGGGEVERCYVHTSQTTGYGMQQGYGGGVCIDYDGSVEHTYIIQCAARIGAGLAICHVPHEYPEQTSKLQDPTFVAAYVTEPDGEATPYDPFCCATVIANCTSNAEGAGVYLDEGGTLNHCTVVNNKCVGPDVIYYGRRHARTGGIYVRNRGTLYNTVAWGNLSPVNNDVQFASFKDAEAEAEGQRIAVYYCAFSKSDITDWATATKENVTSLTIENTPESKDAAGNYPIFSCPTLAAGIQYDPVSKTVNTHANANGEAYQLVFNWHPLAASKLRQGGVQVNDALQGISEEVLHAHTEVDIIGRKFEAISSIGALAQTYRTKSLVLQIMPSLERGEKGRLIPTLLMDPNRKVWGPVNDMEYDKDGNLVPSAELHAGYLDDNTTGECWEHPIGNLGNAIRTLKLRQWTSGPKKDWFNLGGTKNLDGDGNWDGTFTGGTDYEHAQICVKEGKITTAGPGCYLGTQARTASIRPVSNLRIYGGFPSSNTGTTINNRNHRKHPTRVSTNVLNSTYINNGAHVFALINVHDVIIDGFRMYDGNANLSEAHSYAPIDPETGLRETITFGGGIIVNNASVPKAERHNMTGNILRNCVIANCSAPRGAAIYVNGENLKDDDTHCRAELSVINCIMRNCTAGDMHGHDDWYTYKEGAEEEDADSGTDPDKNHLTNNAIVSANGNAHIWMRNCDIVNNCGYALKADNAAMAVDEYQIEIYNSILFSNGRQIRNDRQDIRHPVNSYVVTGGEKKTVIGHYVYVDYDSEMPADYPADQKIFHFLTRTKADNETNNPLWTEDMDEELKTLRYPYFVNPSRNVGHSETGDQPLYGGIVNYQPLNLNPIVNGANPETDDNDQLPVDNASDAYLHNCKSMSYDSALLPRNYGGAPDAGAIENTQLPEGGTVLYVTPNGAGRRDGSSWNNAIAGNLVYRVGGSYVVDDVNGDGDGHTVTTRNNLYRGGYAVDYVYQTGTTTYVDKQTVTQKRINLTYETDGSVTTEDGSSTTLAEETNTQTVTTSNTLTRQKTAYIYGEKSGASRNFYRTNLKDSQIASASQGNNTDGYANVNIDNALSITNNRAEDYVSGLQFAVEKAAELNKGKAKADRAQVWVGNGVYEDYKGFVMRDRVEVFGGFPVTKNTTPGMTERHALVSDVIPLSRINASLADKKAQYETILQIIDKKPFDSNKPLFNDNEGTWAFKKDDVILYTDKDYTESGDKTITTTTSVTVPVYYRRDALPEGGYSEYYEVRGDNVVADCTDRIINPGFEQNGGKGAWNNTKAKYGWPSITGFNLGTSGSNHGAEIKNSNFEFSQDIDNLEPGFYRVSCQGFNKGEAVNNVKLFANGEERPLLSIKPEDASTSTTTAGIALLATGRYDENWVDVYVGEAGHLRIGLKGTYTSTGWTVFDNFRLERLSGSSDLTTSTTTVKSDGYTEKTFSKEYSTFRKPVLYMPDVCLSTHWPGTLEKSDNHSNERRQNISGDVVTPKAGTGYVKYEDAHWDGFTIRNGFVYDYFANRDGGGGIRMFEGGTLENCVVTDNAVMGAIRTRGGGGYCDGKTSKIIGCFFVNNLNTGIRSSKNDKDNNGGGIYMLVGTCYNSLFANNVCWGNDARGAGIYIEQATFYNNTVAYNKCLKRDKTVNTAKGNGVHQYEGANGGAVLNVFNTIFYGNTGPAIGAQDVNKITGFKNCYIKSANEINATIVGKMVDCILDNAGKDKNGKAYNAPNPFEKGDDAPSQNNFRLLNSSLCINSGLIPADQEATFPTKDVDFAAREQDCQIDIGAYEFDGAKFIEPDLSEAGKAIFYVSQNGGTGLATANTPEDAACMVKLQKVLDAAGRWKYAANFYDRPTVDDKDANGNWNMTNFDVRTLKDELTRGGLEPSDENLADLKNRTVIVKLAGDYSRNASGEYTPTFFKYIPTRSTNTKEDMEENLLEYSFMVPHGVQVLGGFTEDAIEKDDGSGESWPGFSDITRDPLSNHTRLSGDVQSAETGASGNSFHVVTFVDDLFTPDEVLYKDDEGHQLTGQLKFLDGSEKDRAVLDGLYIQEGYANGNEDEHKRGGGAIVTDYAHIRNCIVQMNEAVGEGGGLYLKPRALVSGCIIKNNTAYEGGGIYVEEPAIVTGDTYARIISSTVVSNSAHTVAGGMHFKTNVRANSCAFWKNTANDLSNVAGTFSNSGVTQVEENCPFNYCGVESRRISGVNNIELPVAEEEGVRWDHADPHEVMRWNVYQVNRDKSTVRSDSIYYFPINLSSVLGRAGMTYSAYEQLCTLYPTMELTDIAGLNRAEQTVEGERIRLANGDFISKELKNNAFIEMGARVLNGSFELHVEYSHVMTRLFVTTTQLLPSEAALKLQGNTVGEEMLERGVSYASDTPEYLMLENDVEMYKQMGSSFLNPFHRLGDALEYIVRIRKSDEEYTYTEGGSTITTTVGDYYKDQRFEIFMSAGTFYPFRDAHGKQGEARANTFVVPEEVTIVGGVDRLVTGHSYCQATSGTVSIGGYTLDGVSTEQIRADREHMDRNGNHVKEPWELKGQTILSGNAVNNTGSDNTNVYHVITCFPDQKRVGKLPTRTDNDNNILPTLLRKFETTGEGEEEEVEPTRNELLANLEQESRTSRDRRTIFLDGLTITGGHANDIENEDVIDNFQKLTYFRGGGILVEGNWDDSFDQKADLPEVLGVAKRDITLVTANCLFQDNMGGNGGAIYTNGTYYAFGCHFTKNTACGPNTPIDQRYIPWTAGGAIANNYHVHVWNSLFDNNEAIRGKCAILTDMNGDGFVDNPVYDSDARQGYAGAISCSETGLVRVGNCDFVRNKAVSFPAIYNFLDNNLRAYSGQVYTDYYNFLKEHPGFTPDPVYGYDDADDPVKSVSVVNGQSHNYAYYKKEFEDYYYGMGHHFAVNSIFWGNEATASTVNACNWQEYGFYNWRESGYIMIKDDSPSGAWTDSRKPWHIANFGPMLDISTLTFCAFEEDTGREGTVWFDNHERAKSAQIEPKGYPDGLSRLYAGDFLDVLENDFGFYPKDHPDRPIYKKTLQDDGSYKIEPCSPSYAGALIIDADGVTEREPTEEERNSAIAYNYNLVLDSENLDPNGPYFVQPSITAGAEGYMETADWLVSRLNRTIDTGWGMLQQNVTQGSETSALLSTTLLKDDGTGVTPETNQYEELWGEGFYNLHSKNIYARFKDMGFPNLLPIGDEPYMDYTTEGTNETRNMRRISTHPKMGVQKVFIDMGIYEYQYVQLVTGGDQVDVIWVAETEDPSQKPCNGSTWAKATSDLQGAIETLLLSRNDHDKMIKIRGGKYHPMRMTDGNQRAFYINVPSRNSGVLLPAGVVSADDNFGVKSLTIRGGYSNKVVGDDSDGEDTRDAEENRTVFEMVSEAGSTDHMLEHLFIIEDAEAKSTFINYLSVENNKYFEKYPIPIVFEGITFSNPYGNKHHENGGAAILYREQYRTREPASNSFEKDQRQLLEPAKDDGGRNIPKLIIKDCIFENNGKDAQTSALKINKGGGESLIVNTLFHDNSSDPIDAVNTTVINCTFARNGGHLKLKDVPEEYEIDAMGVPGSTQDFYSALHNSIVWRDDQNNAEATQWDIRDKNDDALVLGTSDQLTHNAYSDKDTEPDGSTVEDAKGNFLLSKENDNVQLGPNFTSDYHIGPSAHILNRADVPTYQDIVPYYKEEATQEQKELTSTGEGGVVVKNYYWFHSVQRDNYERDGEGRTGARLTLTDDMLKGTDVNYTEYELAHKARWLNAGVERGAYECTAAVERVLYVMDGATGEEDGTTWEHAFQIDDLQKAIDVASVYSFTQSPQERAYVFVKASDIPIDALKLRDGVSVYGSIAGSFGDLVLKNGDHYDDEDIGVFIAKMQAMRSGIATKAVSHNTLRGLVSENAIAYNLGFTLDGFWLTAGETAGTPVNLVKDNTVLRSCVVTGNNVTGNSPVIDVTKGLLYNTLVYGNTVGGDAPAVRTDANGYVLNCTVVPASGQTAIGTVGAVVKADHAQNNIEAEPTGKMFAPYLNATNVYTLPAHLTGHEPYHYQLHEESHQIDPTGGYATGTDDGGTTPHSGSNSIAELFPDDVDYDHDRDLLGNPRRLGTRVDNGCFETWLIDGDAHVHNMTNIVDLPTPVGEQTQHEANVAAGYYDSYSYTTNYGGHMYPHTGSVTYLKQNANLIVDTDGGTPLFTSTNPLQPGYVLVKKGASVYGQGNTLRFGYVAAEKAFAVDQQYALTSFPFAQCPHDAFASSYESATDELTQTSWHDLLEGYTYDGDKRSKYEVIRRDLPENHFHDDNSTCWKTMAEADAAPATGGWMLRFDDELADDLTLRFTGWGLIDGQAVYAEDASPSKTVTLTQYNLNELGNDTHHYPRFTKLENMGWNLKGQPWLVAQFKTGGTNPDFKMDVPHLFYDMLANGRYDYHDKSLGQLYTKQSWAADVSMDLGQAFFTQTAVIGTSEDLTFVRPTPPVAPTRQEAEVRRLVAVTDEDRYGDVLELNPREDADTDMPYQMGSDGIKWLAFSDRVPQLYVLNTDETPLSLVSAAPTEYDIRLGLKAGKRAQLTVALPQPDAFTQYGHVWLTDHKTGTVTDLLTADYTLEAQPSTLDENRLTLRIGRSLPGIDDRQQHAYIIYTIRDRLTIKNLSEGDLISIYTVGGVLVEQCQASTPVYHRTMRDGTYIVKVSPTDGRGVAVKKLNAHR